MSLAYGFCSSKNTYGLNFLICTILYTLFLFVWNWIFQFRNDFKFRKFVIHHILLKFSETLLCTWLTPPLWPPTCPNWPEVRARLRWKTDKLGTNNFRVSPPRPKWPDLLYKMYFFKIFPLFFCLIQEENLFFQNLSSLFCLFQVKKIFEIMEHYLSMSIVHSDPLQTDTFDFALI